MTTKEQKDLYDRLLANPELIDHYMDCDNPEVDIVIDFVLDALDADRLEQCPDVSSSDDYDLPL